MNIQDEAGNVIGKIHGTIGNFITTFTGREVYPFNPDQTVVCVEDIAHHLALINRWGGATVKPMTVAEHSIRVAIEALAQHWKNGDLHASGEDWRDRPAPPCCLRVYQTGLLHDAHEYILGDFLRPIGSAVHFAVGGQIIPLRDLKRYWDTAIFKALGVAPPCGQNTIAPVVHGDGAVLHAEARDLTVADKAGWSGLKVPPIRASVAEPLRWEQAERAWFHHWTRTTEGRIEGVL